MSRQIILVPGQLCNERIWQHQVPVLSRLGDVIIATQQKHDTIGAMAQSILDGATDRFNLVTHAMGGFVAFEILRRAPERVAKIVLISTLAPADTPQQTVRREGYLRLVEEGKFDGIIEERIPILVHPDRTSDTALVATLRTMAAETGPDAFLNQQRAIMTRADSVASLGAIACPSLIIFGRQDGITNMNHQNQMLAGIPGALLEIIEDCGHMVPLERPEPLNALLETFLTA
ncbi:MAG TPA: alpha/beta fold hydrolase [Rhizomicrobium sp.]|jgi:pimeloyl-ACP methyl ester carboxylesterase|nr:alpha/beta fold hydrolase [Rhizomicrobium sp.]